MLGVGCGFDTLGAGTRTIVGPSKGERVVDIEDTREGWVDSTDILLDSYFNGGPTIIFNYKKIRPRGALLKTFGGVASGPDPLIDMHERLRAMCETYTDCPQSCTQLLLKHEG